MSKNEGIFWKNDNVGSHFVRCLFVGDLKAYHILDGEEEYVKAHPWDTSQNFYDTNFHQIAPKELGLWK